MLTKLNRIQCPRVSTLTRVMLATVLVLFPAMESWAAPAKLALTGGRIITVSGAAIEKGTILIEDGIITAVGDESLEIPYDAMEVDCTGMILAPGFVLPHSKSGLDVPNENLPVAPFVDVYDALDPSRFFFDDGGHDECIVGRSVGQVFGPFFPFAIENGNPTFGEWKPLRKPKET